VLTALSKWAGQWPHRVHLNSSDLVNYLKHIELQTNWQNVQKLLNSGSSKSQGQSLM